MIIKLLEWVYLRGWPYNIPSGEYVSGVPLKHKIIKILGFNKFRIAIYAGACEKPFQYETTIFHWNWRRIINLFKGVGL